MTNGGESKRGTLVLPNQAIEEKVLFPYLKGFPKNLEVIVPNSKYRIENYGFKINTKNHIIGLVTDTAYFPELLNSYNDCEILIINVPYYVQDKPQPKHLDISNVEEFIKAIKPKKVILTHFNCNILNNNPKIIAEELSRKYEIEVLVAEDDMRLEL